MKNRNVVRNFAVAVAAPALALAPKAAAQPIFTNVTTTAFPQGGPPGPVDSSVAWGDYDNDGRLDFLLTGQDNDSNFLSQLWRNNGVHHHLGRYRPQTSLRRDDHSRHPVPLDDGIGGADMDQIPAARLFQGINHRHFQVLHAGPDLMQAQPDRLVAIALELLD